MRESAVTCRLFLIRTVLGRAEAGDFTGPEIGERVGDW